MRYDIAQNMALLIFRANVRSIVRVGIGCHIEVTESLFASVFEAPWFGGIEAIQMKPKPRASECT